MTTQRQYFFVYVILDGDVLDKRMPCGGLTVCERDEVKAVDAAYKLAEQRFPVRPGQIIVVVWVHSKTRKLQAWLMERDWLAAYQDFESLMTVS